MATGTVNRPLGNYKTFYTVTSLGLTAGSATVSDAWNALPTQSILIAGVGNFATGARPYSSAYGQIVIVKNTATNGYIYLHGLTENVGDFRMYLTGSPEVPSGTWVPCETVINSATPTATVGTYDTNSYGLRKNGSIVTCHFRVSGVDVGTSYSIFATIPEGFRPKNSINRLCGMAGYVPVGIYISASGNVSVQGETAMTGKAIAVNATWSTE